MQLNHKRSRAWSCGFGVLLMELPIKNYVESWGQTLGMSFFDLQILPCRPPGPTCGSVKVLPRPCRLDE